MSEGLPEVAPVHLHTSGISRIRHWMRRVLGVDRAIGFTVLARFWSSAASLFTVALIAPIPFPRGAGILLHIWKPGLNSREEKS